MKSLLSSVLVMLLASASALWSQTAPQPRKPSAELQKEGDYFVGNWKFTGETKPSQFGVGGQKFDASERLEWLPGGFFLMARSYEGEKWSGLTIIGYDEDKKVFTHTSYTSTGKVEVMTGTSQGDTELWTGDVSVHGTPAKQRFTIKKVTPTLYTFKFEIARESNNWALVYEGQAVKTP